MSAVKSIRVTSKQWRDIQQVCQERGIELCYSVEKDGVYVYGSGSELEEIEHIIWAIQVVDGLAMVLVESENSEREGAFCRIDV